MRGAAPYRTAKYNKGNIAAEIAHDLRQKDAEGKIKTKSNKDIDSARTLTENKYLIAGENGGKMMTQAEVDALLAERPRLVQEIIEQKIAEANDELERNGLRPVLVRDNSVLAVEVVIDVPQEWWDAHSDKDRSAFINRAVQFNDQEYGGRDRRLFVAVHGDEKADRKHVHVFYLPLTPDLRLSAKDMIGGPAEMHRRQERYYEQVAAPFGMPKPDFGSQTKHLKTRAFKEAKELAKKQCQKILELAQKKAQEDAAEVMRQAKEAAAAVQAEIEVLRQKAHEKYAAAAEHLQKVDAYYARVEELLPGFLDDVISAKSVEEIDFEKYDPLFKPRSYRSELGISISRVLRQKATFMRNLLEDRANFRQR